MMYKDKSKIYWLDVGSLALEMHEIDDTLGVCKQDLNAGLLQQHHFWAVFMAIFPVVVPATKSKLRWTKIEVWFKRTWRLENLILRVERQQWAKSFAIQITWARSIAIFMLYWPANSNNFISRNSIQRITLNITITEKKKKYRKVDINETTYKSPRI